MSSTAYLPALQFLCLFVVFPMLTASSHPSLLSLNCTPPSRKSVLLYKSVQTLLDNLTSQVSRTQLVTSSMDLGSVRFSALVQCRLHLAPTTCSLCAQTAKQTMSSLCPHADTVTAWFDGCCLRYGVFSHDQNLEAISWSCSNEGNARDDTVQFESALETLFLQLRADISMATHHLFSTRELHYGNSSRVYALAECVQSVSPKECEVCVGKGIEKVYEHCGGKQGAAAVAWNCTVRYESYQFFHADPSGLLSGFGNGSRPVSVWNSETSGGGIGFKAKVALAWGTGVACCLAFVFSAWLFRRTVLNKAKIITSVDADGDEVGSKVTSP